MTRNVIRFCGGVSVCFCVGLNAKYSAFQIMRNQRGGKGEFCYTLYKLHECRINQLLCQAFNCALSKHNLPGFEG